MQSFTHLYLGSDVIDKLQTTVEIQTVGILDSMKIKMMSDSTVLEEGIGRTVERVAEQAKHFWVLKIFTFLAVF